MRQLGNRKENMDDSGDEGSSVSFIDTALYWSHE